MALGLGYSSLDCATGPTSFRCSELASRSLQQTVFRQPQVADQGPSVAEHLLQVEISKQTCLQQSRIRNAKYSAPQWFPVQAPCQMPSHSVDARTDVYFPSDPHVTESCEARCRIDYYDSPDGSTQFWHSDLVNLSM